jgi:hypothetical protein
MNPSFGVPWPRLQRAAARLREIPEARDAGRVSALLFLCGLQYLLTYRRATRRRLSHYLDDGLREAVLQTLPVLMKCRARSTGEAERERSVLGFQVHPEFRQLTLAFSQLHQRLPHSSAQWLANDDANVIRLTFGMGVAARFAPESHEFIRRLLSRPLILPASILDVVESFHWHPAWSVALAA